MTHKNISYANKLKLVSAIASQGKKVISLDVVSVKNSGILLTGP